MNTKHESGPLDEQPFPSKLTARVAAPGTDVRLHGYSIDRDLAAHYTFGELILLAMTGVAPDAACGRAFDVALAFFAGTTAAEAPIHAALLARVCAATTSAISGTGAIALAEQARFDLIPYAPFFAWLAAPSPTLPIAFTAKSPEDRGRTSALRAALTARDVAMPTALSFDLDPVAATLAVLASCGIRTIDQAETLRVLARFPILMAEALASTPAKYRDYPVHLPAIRYEEVVS